MNFLMLKIKFLFFLFCLISLTLKPAYAYLDPGIFTFLWQGIIIVIASAAVSIKIFWNKILDIRDVLKKKFNVNKKK